MGLQLPTSFGLAFLLRILPGMIVSCPLLLAISPLIGLNLVGTRFEQQVLIVGIVGLLLGVLLYCLDFRIYTFYEGRFGWLSGLRNYMVHRLNEEIRCKYAEEKELFDAVEHLRQLKPLTIERQRQINALELKLGEIWFYLLQFPLVVANGNAQHRALSPTRLGNIMLEGELYPERKYGMDIVFYWPRMRFIVPKDVWTEIDTTKALVDFLAYLSFALIVYTPIHIIAYLVLGLPLQALMGLLLPLAAYLLYRVSWDELRTYYDYVKAVFDSYRKDLGDKLMIKGKKEIEKEKEEWDKRWRYLQYHEYP